MAAIVCIAALIVVALLWRFWRSAEGGVMEALGALFFLFICAVAMCGTQKGVTR